MSYSFTVTAATKDEAKQKIAEQFAMVVRGQPTHAADQDAAVAAGCAFVDLLTAEMPADHEILVSMHGSLAWNEANKFTGSGIGISAHYRSVKANG